MTKKNTKQKEMTVGVEFTDGESSWWRGDHKPYRDLYGHSRKMANISLRLKENKNVQVNHNRLIYYGANYVKITTK